LGCEISNQEETIDFGGIIIVAIPFINYKQLPIDLLIKMDIWNN